MLALVGCGDDPPPTHATYSNARYGFSFDYPVDWEMIERQDEKPIVAVRSKSTESFGPDARGRPNFHVMVGRGRDLDDHERGIRGALGLTVERRQINGHPASVMAYLRDRFKLISAVVMRGDGGYAILTGTASPECWATYGPEFERIVESFEFR